MEAGVNAIEYNASDVHQYSWQTCRLCMKRTERKPSVNSDDSGTETTSEEMIFLNDNVELLERIYTLTSLQLRNAPLGLLLYVCHKCEGQLSQYNTFRNQCIMNDFKFKETFYSYCNEKAVPDQESDLIVYDPSPDYEHGENQPEPYVESINVTAADGEPMVQVQVAIRQDAVEITPPAICDSIPTINPPADESPIKQQKNLTAKSKLYQCSICEKILCDNRNLNIHLRSHTGEKPYACNVCGKTFSQSAYRNLHQKKHNGWRPHGCEQCEKRFATVNELKNHRDSHKDEKSYECPVCKKRFRYAPNLRAHMPRHKEGNARVCSVCGKVLSDPGSLSLHMRSHAAKKMHSCDKCDQTFCSQLQQQQHMLLHTGS